MACTIPYTSNLKEINDAIYMGFTNKRPSTIGEILKLMDLTNDILVIDESVNKYGIIEKSSGKRMAEIAERVSSIANKLYKSKGGVDKTKTEDVKKQMQLGTLLHSVGQIAGLAYHDYKQKSTDMWVPHTSPKVKREVEALITSIINKLVNSTGAIDGVSEEVLKEFDKAAAAGDFKVDKLTVYNMIITAMGVVDDVYAEQSQIDNTKAPVIRFEQKLMNLELSESLAGTGDLVIVYSDMSMGYIDYKTFEPSTKYSESIASTDSRGNISYTKVVTRDNSYEYTRLEKWKKTVPAYEDMLLKRYGAKFIRTSRIVPIATFWNKNEKIREIYSTPGYSDEYKKQLYREQALKGDTRGDSVTNIETMYTANPAGMAKKLTNVIISKEVLANQSLRGFVDQSNRQMSDLAQAQARERSSEGRGIIGKKIASINNMINNVTLFHNLTPTFEYLDSLLARTQRMLDGKEIDTTVEDIVDPVEKEIKAKYNRVVNISKVRGELSYYNNLLSMATDIINNSPGMSDEQKIETLEIAKQLHIRMEMLKIGLKEAQHAAVFALSTDLGMPSPDKKVFFEDDTYMQFHTQGANNSNNPFLNEMHRRVAMIDVKATKDFEKFLAKSEGIFTKLKTWMQRNNWDEAKFRDFFINFKTGNLKAIYNPEVRTKLEAERMKAAKSKDPKFYKDNFKIKDTWQKSYDLRLANFIARLEDELLFGIDPEHSKYKTRVATLLSEVRDWEARNNFFVTSNNVTYDSDGKYILNRKQSDIDNNIAWLNEKNININTEWKDSFKQQYYTDHYKFMQANPDLLNWYEHWTESMREAREIFGIFDNRVLPANFIPNMLNEVVTAIRDAGVVNGVQTSWNMYMAHLKINIDEVVEYQDGNGNIIRNIPVAYLNPFKTVRKDADGKVTSELTPGAKSYDMQRVLTDFMRGAYAYRYKQEEEGVLHALKNTMQDYAEVYQTNKAGGLALDPAGNPQTRAVDKDVVKAFDDYISVYINGKVIVDKDRSIGGYSAQKMIMAAQTLFAKKVLGYNLYAPFAAYWAGRIGTKISAVKGAVFTEEQHNAAIKLKGSIIGTVFKSDTAEAKKVKTFLYRFDPYTQSHFKHAGWKTSTRSGIEKFFSERSQFIAFEYGDDLNIDTIALSMAQAYGLDANNKLRHISNLKSATNPNPKSLWDMFSMSEGANGEVNTKVVNDQGKELTEAEMDDVLVRYRNAVQEVQKGIMGTQSDRNVSLYSVKLLGKMMGMFRNWIPNLINEMTKPLMYNKNTDIVDIGRYTAVGRAALDLNKGNETWAEIAKGFATIAGYIAVDLIPFINLTTSKVKQDQEGAKIWFENWKENHPQLAKNQYGDEITFEQYQQAKINQLRTLIYQLRVLALMAIIMMFAGGDWDDDGKPDYRQTWVGRQAYRVFNRVWGETASMYSFTDFNRLIGGGGLPVWSLVEDVFKLLSNGMDETRDLIVGENSSKDTTPMFYYTIGWVPLLARLRKIFELADSEYKSVR